MSDNKTKALEARIESLEAELSALTKAIAVIVSQLARNDPKRARFAERLRTIGERPGMESEAVRHLLDDIADRIDTIGTPPTKDG
jgi:uncharacterized coiled-coil protein SlyX